MDLLKDIQLSFRTLKKDENLYDDVDVHAHSVVDAQYGKRPGYENVPEICALPKLRSNAGLIELATTGLVEYNPEAIRQMKPYEKKENLLLLQKAYYPLGHLFDIAYAVDAALVSSYMARESRCSSLKEPSELTAHGIPGTVYSIRNGMVGRAYSFLVVGQTGCGKTVSVNQIKNLYPQAIRHTIGNREYVQIPILMVTAMVGNMMEMVTALATRIDEILDTNTFHVDQVRKKNVGMACNRLKEWIKRYHIGLLIIDEVQFMNFGEGASSFENLVGIAEETGCALGLIGNQDVNEKLYRYPRLINRVMLNRIEIGFADESSRGFFVNALNQLWEYQWTKVKTVLTDDIRNELIRDSMYNISILKALLIRVQYEALKKYPKDGITVDYIHKIAENEFAQMRALILKDTPDNERKVLELLRKQNDSIRDDAKKQAQKDRMDALKQAQTGQFLAENEWKLGSARTILSYLGYTDTQIKRAVTLAMKKDSNVQYLDVPDIVDTVKKILASSKPDIGAKVPKVKVVNTDVEQAVRDAMQPEINSTGVVAI